MTQPLVYLKARVTTYLSLCTMMSMLCIMIVVILHLRVPTSRYNWYYKWWVCMLLLLHCSEGMCSCPSGASRTIWTYFCTWK